MFFMSFMSDESMGHRRNAPNLAAVDQGHVSNYCHAYPYPCLCFLIDLVLRTNLSGPRGPWSMYSMLGSAYSALRNIERSSSTASAWSPLANNVPKSSFHNRQTPITDDQSGSVLHPDSVRSDGF